MASHRQRARQKWVGRHVRSLSVTLVFVEVLPEAISTFEDMILSLSESKAFCPRLCSYLSAFISQQRISQHIRFFESLMSVIRNSDDKITEYFIP